MRTTLMLAASLALAAPARAAGPPPMPPPPPIPLPPVHAVHADHAITIDGRLDEDVWRTAEPTLLIQTDPDRGAVPRQRTEVRVAFDDQALYVGARMFDSAPDSIAARLARRDNSTAADGFLVYLDPLHDRRTGYYFELSAAGTELDGILFNDDWNDDSWDGVWSGRTHRDSTGWTAEMRIPFSQLRFRSGDEAPWGINFKRFISRYSEEDQLVCKPRDQSGFVSRFADLVGMGDPHAGRRLEVTPYVTSKGEFLVHSAGDPFNDGSSLKGNMGGDLRTAVGSKLTLNATVNPDFGQVEIDPAVVNLSDVETFFQEKRPFFTEGVSIFRCGNNGASDYWGFNWSDPTFFYSRRIGRRPEGGVPTDADYADVPNGTHILGAAKVTGQIAPGWSFGTLHALTERETAQLDIGGARSRFGVEPLTYYGVVRGMHEMNDRRQGLGFMGQTSVRSFDGDEALRSEVNTTGSTATFDGWTFLDPSRTWVLSGWAGATNVTGSRARITSLQQAPTHYFQRPDARYLGVDTSATSLTGGGVRLWLNKQNGRLLSNSAFGFMSPGFDVNDMGFMSRADVINGHLGLGWQWNEPKGWRQYANVISALASSWDFGGNNTLKGWYVGTSIEQRNHWSWNESVFFLPGAVSNRKTRGGPVMKTNNQANLNLYFDTNGQKPFFWYIQSNPTVNQDGSHEWNVNPGIRWRPASNLSFQAGPNYDRTIVDAQYVITSADAAATQTYGNHYVFARLDQTTFSADLRMDFTMTPTLCLQIYAQPLVSTGHYTNYRELARPRTYSFNVYDQTALPGYVPDLDFTYRTVRANTVLRWEYLPGSTFYAVWTQDRTTSDSDNQFDLNSSLADLAHAQANNVFLVKVAHHFDL